MDQASALAPLGSFRIHNRFKSHLNLGQYELALADLTLFKEMAEKGEETTVSYMPPIATKWKGEVWYYSGYSSCSNPLSGFNQEYLSQESLVLNNGSTWTELPEFSPPIGQYGINMNNISVDDIFVDAPENSVYYVTKKIEMDKSGFYQIAFDSDDAMMAWINGELIHTYFHNNGRGLVWPGRDLVSAWLQKGVNIITIKI